MERRADADLFDDLTHAFFLCTETVRVTVSRVLFRALLSMGALRNPQHPRWFTKVSKMSVEKIEIEKRGAGK